MFMVSVSLFSENCCLSFFSSAFNSAWNSVLWEREEKCFPAWSGKMGYPRAQVSNLYWRTAEMLVLVQYVPLVLVKYLLETEVLEWSLYFNKYPSKFLWSEKFEKPCPSFISIGNLKFSPIFPIQQMILHRKIFYCLPLLLHRIVPNEFAFHLQLLNE